MMGRARLRHIIAAEFLFLVGFAMMVPLLPLFARDLGAGATLVGVLLAANQAVDFFFAPVAGRLSDRYGRRAVLLPAMLISAIAYLTAGFAASIPALLMIWTLAGFGSSHVLLSQAYVADITSDRNRPAGMGYWGASFALAFVIGPPAGAILYSHGPSLAAAAAAAVAGLATLYAALFVREPLRSTPRRPGQLDTVRHLGELRRAVLTIIALYFAAIFIWSQFTTILPLYSQDVFGWEVRSYGLYLGTIGLIAAVLQGGFAGRIVRRWGYRIPVTIGFGLLGLGLGMLAAPRTPLTLVGSAVGIAAGFGLLIPSLPALLSLNVRPESKGFALGVFQSASTLARVFAPLLAGVIYDQVFPAAPLLLSATLGLLLMVLSTLFNLRDPNA